jgi:hypothetical protein
MGTAHVTFSQAGGGNVPVLASVPTSVQTLTTSTTATATAITARGGEYATIMLGQTSYVSMARAPVAGASTDGAATKSYLLPAGVHSFGPLAQDDKVSVKDLA